jgi:glutathione S-transferase
MLQAYRIPFSTNVERLALAAGHKGVDVDWIDVDPDDRSPVVAVSGQPLVPVLVAGDEVLSDSPVILEWLEERYPEPTLYPTAPDEARLFIRWFNEVWKRPPNLLAEELERAEPDQGLVDLYGLQLRAAIPFFERLLENREHLFGEFGMADVVAFPFLKYAVFGLPEDDDELFHRVLVEHQPLDDGSPLRAWAARVDARPRS